MPVYSHPRCKICKSPFRDKIDEMLAAGVAQTRIIALSTKDWNMNLNGYNVCIHNKKHRRFLPVEIESQKAASRSYAFRQKRALELADGMVVLQDVVNQIATDLASGEMKPSLNEGLKAIELILKYRDGSPMESMLTEFLMNLNDRIKS